MKQEWRCEDCGEYIAHRDLLTAPNPFDPKDTINGCPKCKCIGRFEEVCDEDGCKKLAGCGWPSTGAYRRTCYEHWQKD